MLHESANLQLRTSAFDIPSIVSALTKAIREVYYIIL